MTLGIEIIEAAAQVSTATFTTVLLKKGLRNVWMRGPRPLKSGQKRLISRAFTLRFVPAREDLATPESWSSPRSTRAAIEQERFEAWIIKEVEKGAALPGLYPANAETKARYEKSVGKK